MRKTLYSAAVSSVFSVCKGWEKFQKSYTPRTPPTDRSGVVVSQKRKRDQDEDKLRELKRMSLNGIKMGNQPGNRENLDVNGQNKDIQ